MTGPIPPYALFVLAEDIDVRYLNESLFQAYQGFDEVAWDLYVATDSYNEAPTKLEGRYPEGTKAPLKDVGFRSSFIGQTLEFCGEWLQNAPAHIALNRDYFTAMDQFSRVDDTVLICRVIPAEDGGELIVEYFPEKTEDATIQISVSIGLRFDEALQRYQRNRMRDGKPDRSKGGPYGNVPSP
ncbi:Fc.00g105510.m01.CDS01 [Cosmosporella sp. VM-42]